MPQPVPGTVVGDLTARRGIVDGRRDARPDRPNRGRGAPGRDLRLLHRSPQPDPGPGTFTMEFARYKRLPASLAEEVIAQRKNPALAAAV